MKKNSPSGAFVPAGLLIGMGVGFLTGNLLAGLFVGLGAGILVMALIELVISLRK
jgi:predicted lipid-binding transport protein (Tim44 family)